MKKTIFSGIQPSGKLTLGNYLGAIKNWVSMSNEYECRYSVVDLHAITVRQDPAEFRRQVLEVYAQLVACGVDPSANPNITLFVQSHVPEHIELMWALGCFTMFGELSRMTQFKDKSKAHADNVNAGLFTYPVLMASDILLYDTDVVPVGEDQKQHVEITRDIALRFNGAFPDTLVVPEPVIPKIGARIMSLSEPNVKMSKSDPNESSYILLGDSDDDIMKKFKRAVTDSDSAVRFDPAEKPGVSNLMGIYAAVTGKSLAEVEREFEGKGYGDFKSAVGEVVRDRVAPIREETARLLENPDHLEKLCEIGAGRAEVKAREVVDRVYGRMGFVRRPR